MFSHVGSLLCHNATLLDFHGIDESECHNASAATSDPGPGSQQIQPMFSSPSRLSVEPSEDEDIDDQPGPHMFRSQIKL